MEAERRARELKARQCRLYLKKLAGLGDDDTSQSNIDADNGSGAGLGETFLALVDRVAGEKLAIPSPCPFRRGVVDNPHFCTHSAEVNYTLIP